MSVLPENAPGPLSFPLLRNFYSRKQNREFRKSIFTGVYDCQNRYSFRRNVYSSWCQKVFIHVGTIVPNYLSECPPAEALRRKRSLRSALLFASYILIIYWNIWWQYYYTTTNRRILQAFKLSYRKIFITIFYVLHKPDLYLHGIFMFLSYYSFIQLRQTVPEKAGSSSESAFQRRFSARNSQDTATAAAESSNERSRK